MVDNPEAIANALLAVLTSGTASISWAQTPSRAAKIWGSVSPANQPCMFVIGGGGALEQKVGYGVSRHVLHFTVLVYMRADESSGSIPETQLNTVWTAIANAMLPSMPGRRQDLGVPNLVNNACIEGDWFMDSGILDAQQALLIPIKVYTGAF